MNERYSDAYNDLGGHDSLPSVDSARAMLAAGMGGERERKIVARADAETARDRYTDEHLSGIAERTPEQDAAVQDLRRTHLAETAAKAIANGEDPVRVAALQRAKEERRNRGL